MIKMFALIVEKCRMETLNINLILVGSYNL